MKLTNWRRVEEMRTAARKKMAAAGTATAAERFRRDNSQMGLREGGKIEVEIGNLCIWMLWDLTNLKEKFGSDYFLLCVGNCR